MYNFKKKMIKKINFYDVKKSTLFMIKKTKIFLVNIYQKIICIKKLIYYM